MKAFLRVTLTIYVIAFSSGCASILAGKTQNLTISTNPPGANCQLTRQGEIVGSISPSPGAIMVNKTKHDISVVCKKEGYQDATGFLKSGTEGATFVNILAGGVIGWGIDSASGADNKYPEVTTITLVPIETAAPPVQVPQDMAKTPEVPKHAPPHGKVSIATTKPGTQPAPASVAERLKTLDDLKAKNLISDEDYKKTREKILNEL